MNIIDYDNSIVSLANSILKYFGVKPYHKTLKVIDDLLVANQYKNVVVLLCDGLGSKNLSDCLKSDDILRRNKIGNLMSVYPPTTTAATTSFLTGLWPCEHHWYGWDMYFKDTDEVISLYLNKVRETGCLATKKVLDRDYMHFRSLVEMINDDTSCQAYYAYPYDHKHPCVNLDMVLERIEKLCSLDGKKFVYGYIENPDKLMHHYGIYSKVVKDNIHEINDKVQCLTDHLKDTILIVIADHGLIKTNYINLKHDIPLMYAMIERTTLESRTCGIKLKAGVDKKDFVELFNKFLSDSFVLLTKDDVIGLHLFGDDYNEYLDDNIGDFVLTATGNVSIIFDDSFPVFKANHAGNTMDEILVPLIVFDCKN